MKLGVDYYPEQWPEANWAADAKMMADLGLTYVRIGEFTWSLLEPEEGRFELDWLERAVAALYAQNLQVILGTPTAAPPPWLAQTYDIFQRDANRTILGAGSRCHRCANNPTYRRLSTRIVTVLAQHFARHKGIVGWQIDNEFTVHQTGRCYCDHCHSAFQRWLRQKYQTLDQLNRVWGTVFWSATYTDWGQIPLPRSAPARHNPGLQLDFYRFSSDSWQQFQKLQIDLIRQHAPYHFVTHNYLGSGEAAGDQLDYYDLAADLDFVSWDNYPQGAAGPDHVAFNHDLTRGFKRKAHWVMEQQPGVVNWHPYNRPVPPGLVRLWTYQGFGRGAEAIVYFRWRAARYGQEQYHAGLLRQDGSPTRAFAEAGQVARELEQLPDFKRKAAQVALLFDYDDWWSLQLDPHQQDFSYLDLALNIYHDLWAAGVPVDIIRRGESLDSYRVVLVPAPILIDAGEADRWQEFVEAGGWLMTTFRTFVKDKSNAWTDQPLPAQLDSLFGVRVAEYVGLPPDMRGAARNESGSLSFPYWKWAEVLEPAGSQPLLFYNQFYWRDGVAATKRNVGQGVAVYVGCWFEHMLPQTVWDALGLAEFALPFQLPQDVEAIAIEFDDGRPGLILLNHNAAPVSVHLHQPAAALLLNFPPMTLISLPPRDVAILRF